MKKLSLIAALLVMATTFACKMPEKAEGGAAPEAPAAAPAEGHAAPAEAPAEAPAAH